MQKVILFAVFAALAMACNVAKFVPQDDYLLNKERLKVSGKGIDKEDLSYFVRQHPNSSIMGFRLNLWLYNLSSPNKERWIDRKLRQFGEPPVIFDSVQAALSVARLEEYAELRGYYGTTAQLFVEQKKQKSNVTYSVRLAQPYYIGNIAYQVLDSTLQDISFIVDSTKTWLHKGNIFDGEVLEQETDRIAQEMRHRGYYRFTKNYITFNADTTVGNHKVNLTLVVQKELVSSLTNERRNHRLFTVDKLTLNADYDPMTALQDSAYWMGWDTMSVFGFEQIYKDVPGLHPNIAAIYNAIPTGQLYNEQTVNTTYSNFSNLRIFKSVNIRFEELPVPAAADSAPRILYPLQGNIVLSPLTLQGYSVGGEVSASGNSLWGASANLNYHHNNLFKGAEIFEAGANITFQKVQLQTDATPQNSIEVGINASINVPQFSFPFKLSFYRNFNSPRTQLQVSGNYQQQPSYERWLSSATFGYSWRNLGNVIYIFNPIDVAIINIQQKEGESAFWESLSNNPYLVSAYQNTFLLGSTMSLTYNRPQRLQRKNYCYLRLGAELKGNLLALGYSLLGKPQGQENNDKHYRILDTRFAQFAKFDANFNYLHSLDEQNAIATRVLVGFGTAYGNSLAMPFDKMYSAGGANSLRGWQIRNVGPGNYSSTSGYIADRVANMRVELNAEYRFKLVGMLEGAAFVDAGNIWATSRNDERAGSRLNFAKLHEQIAINWGVGLRFVLNLLVVRVDYGIQLHDPSTSGKYWIGPDKWFRTGYHATMIALGYPF
ncbi:membrane protein [Bacteroidia bacterium]|nr:membrane protein [Bacteroidia bacterium]